MQNRFFQILWITALLWLGACQLPADSEIQEAAIAFGFSEPETGEACGSIAVYPDGTYMGEGSCFHGKIIQGKIGPKEIEQIQSLMAQYQDLDLKEVNYENLSWISFYGSGIQTIPETEQTIIAALCQSILNFSTRAGGGTGGLEEAISSINPPDPGVYQPLSGVMVAASNTVSQINPNGSVSFLSDTLVKPLLPLNGTMLYLEKDDIWIINSSKEERNLTNSPDHIESQPDRQLLNGSRLVFLSRKDDQPENSTQLSTIDLDGKNYTILENVPDVTTFSVSSNGTQIAYSTGDRGGILQLNGNQVVNHISLEATLAEMGITQISAPIWAPNGQRLAWLVETKQAGTSTWAYAFHDIQLGSLVLVHPFNLINPENLPNNGRWSPDSAWFAVSIRDTNSQKTGVWLLPWDTQKAEKYTGKTINPIWSPTGALVVQTLDHSEWWLYPDVDGAYQVVPVFPSGSYILDWFDNPMP